jgi:uncharacterized protein (DUF302 family)
MNTTLGFEVALEDGIDRAIEKVAEALKTEGFGILTRIDVKATLKEKLGEDFRPYVILGACHPPTAHRALAHNALVGLLLPCNVTVEAAAHGGSIVRIVNPETMFTAGGIEQDPVIRELATETRERLERVAGVLRKNA